MAWSETASVDMARGKDEGATVLIGAQSAANSSPAPASDRSLDPDKTQAGASLDDFKKALVFGQIRIERRVIVRISPRGIGNRRNMLARLPRRANTTEYKERKAERCVPVNNIAGVETGSGNRLLLFMQDAQILSLNLEKACRAKDFYSGFYVEQNKDGNLCVDRDTLQSRNGARCDIERMMELVAIED